MFWAFSALFPRCFSVNIPWCFGWFSLLGGFPWFLPKDQGMEDQGPGAESGTRTVGTGFVNEEPKLEPEVCSSVQQ